MQLRTLILECCRKTFNAITFFVCLGLKIIENFCGSTWQLSCNETFLCEIISKVMAKRLLTYLCRKKNILIRNGKTETLAKLDVQAFFYKQPFLTQPQCCLSFS